MNGSFGSAPARHAAGIIGGAVSFLRFFRAECIEAELDVELIEPQEDETEAQRAKRLAKCKDRVLDALTSIYERSGLVVNRSKFLKDLDHRERKATTAIAPGIAIPHVRTLQMRGFVMGFARAKGDGVPFLSLDGEPTKLFVLLASPPYDDRAYLQVYKGLAPLLLDEDFTDELVAAPNAQAIYQAFRQRLG
jgi:mannitol/fructose-specific phosphotransferase system IIA component (Ntr-type)